MNEKVLVTGIGAISPIGNDVSTIWQNAKQGKSGIGSIQGFDASELPVQIAAEVKRFDWQDYGLSKQLKRLDTFIQYGMAASQQAVIQAALDTNPIDPSRVSVIVGSGVGGIGTIEQSAVLLKEKGARKISPFLVPGVIVNMLPGMISIEYGFKGANLAISTACSTGTHAVSQGAQMIQMGLADAVIVGGAEKASSPLGISGFAAARALSTRNDDSAKASRPWDVDRDGFVLGDGAGILVLESERSAIRRGVKPLAEVVGYGMTSDAHHMTTPAEDGEGAKACMRLAIEQAGILPSQIGYINAHGTSTPAGDMIEARAISEVFASSLGQLVVSSSKSMTGHLLGAAGALEAILCIETLNAQYASPTVNLEQPELVEGVSAQLDLNPLQGKEIQAEYALSNSFGFGGTNGSLIFKKC